MAKAKLAWWILPGVITGSLTMLGGLGTCAVKYAKFESLPTKVEAGEAKNVEQDQKLYNLSHIADQNQQILDRLTQSPMPIPTIRLERELPTPRLREWDDTAQTFWCCTVSSEEWRQWCFDYDQWFRCPND